MSEGSVHTQGPEQGAGDPSRRLNAQEREKVVASEAEDQLFQGLLDVRFRNASSTQRIGVETIKDSSKNSVSIYPLIGT
jgi:hypothetical protein